MDKVLLVIPAYNEEKNIGRAAEIISAISRTVNDGSRDHTAHTRRERGITC